MLKRNFTCMLILFFSACLQAQDVKIFEKVELEANTDIKAWTEHIKKNSRLPDSVTKKIPAGTYKVNVQFVVDVHGNIGQVKAKENPGFGFAEKAEQILRGYKGQWKPASQCGRLVKSYKTQPVVFIIAD